jgi:hypothetical protein
VTEKVDPRSLDNSLPVRIALSASRPRFVCPFHIQSTLITMWKLIQYIKFPRSTVDILLYFSFTQTAANWENPSKKPNQIGNTITMAGYSETSLPQKLGIKPGLSVVTINAPTNYRRLLGTIPVGVTFSDRLRSDSSFVHVFIKKRSELEKRLSDLREKITDTGTVWVSWPKRSSGVLSDVTEDVVRAVALPLGFVDVKVCAIDETWSGLKLMVRRINRKPPFGK